MELSYPTDMSAEPWALLAQLLPSAKSGGRPRRVERRAIVNVSFSIVVAGCAGRMLPKVFPNWKTVDPSCRAWRLDGAWEQIHAKFVAWERVPQGHQAVPSAASLDSQSVKTATPAALAVGLDGGKKIKGRKRHLLVATLRLVMMVGVTAAPVSDPQGARLSFTRLAALPERMARLLLIWVDGT